MMLLGIVTLTQQAQAQVKNFAVVEEHSLQTDSVSDYFFLRIMRPCSYPNLLLNLKKEGFNIVGEPGLEKLLENSIYQVFFNEVGEKTFEIDFCVFPYWVNKSEIIKELEVAIHDQKVKGIKAVVKSEGEGFIVQLDPKIKPKKVLSKIYKETRLGSLLESVTTADIIGVDETENLFKHKNKLYVSYLASDDMIYRMPLEKIPTHSIILTSKPKTTVNNENWIVKK